MRKKHLDNAYNNILKDEFEIFSLTLPISIIYKSLYNKIETLLQSKYNLIHSEIDVLAALFFLIKKFYHQLSYMMQLFFHQEE